MFAYCGNNPTNSTDITGGRPRYIQDEYYATEVNPDRIVGNGQGKNSAPDDYRTYNSEEKSKDNNCYSYAFNLPCTLNPGYLAVLFGRYKHLQEAKVYAVYRKRYFSVGEIAQLVMDDMRAINHSCRRISSPQEADNGELVVALKTGTYIFTYQMTDYHFAVLLSDGTWADKPGNTSVRRGYISGYDDAWPLFGICDEYYCSPTVFFAIGG